MATTWMIALTWDPPLFCGAYRPKANPSVRQRSLPALKFRSHRDLTEFFNSLLERDQIRYPQFCLLIGAREGTERIWSDRTLAAY